MTPQHVREAAVGHLLELKARGYTSAEAERCAAQLASTDPRTVRRWLAARDADTAGVAEPGALSLQPFVVDDTVLQAIAAHRTLRRAYEDLHSTGMMLPGYRQFCRITAQQMHAGVRAALLGDGAKTFHAKHLYLTSAVVPDRNSVWQMDAQEVPVRVLAPRGRIVKPWQLSIIDVATRAIVGTLLTENRPNGGDVKACLALAVRGRQVVSRAGVTWIGGLPETIVVDNGGEFIGAEFSEVCSRLGVLLSPTGAYAGWEKPNIERWHRTIQEELYSQFVGFTHGPLSHTQTEYWDPRETRPAALTSLELLQLAVDDWVEQYNVLRPHSSLQQQTPVQAWIANVAVLNPVADELLHDCWYEAPKKRKVGKVGISFANALWAHPQLDGRIGEELTVRWLPASNAAQEQIAVYDGDVLVCVAGRADRMSVEERRETLRARREAYLQLRSAEKAAARRRQQAHDDVIGVGGLPADRSLAAATHVDVTLQLLELADDEDPAGEQA